MAERENGATSPSGSSPFLGLHLASPPNFRLTHDISLEEFEDEDLSEITDECGISLHCKDSLASRGHVNLQGSGVLGVAGGEASRLQAEMLQLDLIDAAGETPGEEGEGEGRAPEPIQKEAPPVTMETYRPKRPTTLNLFPQVPRTQRMKPEKDVRKILSMARSLQGHLWLSLTVTCWTILHIYVEKTKTMTVEK